MDDYSTRVDDGLTDRIVEYHQGPSAPLRRACVSTRIADTTVRRNFEVSLLDCARTTVLALARGHLDERNRQR
jgi:hypothetical protein